MQSDTKTILTPTFRWLEEYLRNKNIAYTPPSDYSIVELEALIKTAQPSMLANEFREFSSETIRSLGPHNANFELIYSALETEGVLRLKLLTRANRVVHHYAVKARLSAQQAADAAKQVADRAKSQVQHARDSATTKAETLQQRIRHQLAAAARQSNPPAQEVEMQSPNTSKEQSPSKTTTPSGIFDLKQLVFRSPLSNNSGPRQSAAHTTEPSLTPSTAASSAVK